MCEREREGERERERVCVCVSDREQCRGSGGPSYTAKLLVVFLNFGLVVSLAWGREFWSSLAGF